jgi:hypothetical protein
LTNKKLELPLAAMFSYQGIFVDDLSYIILVKLGFREDKNVKMVDNGDVWKELYKYMLPFVTIRQKT